MADSDLQILTKLLHRLLDPNGIDSEVQAAVSALRKKVKASASATHFTEFRVLGAEMTAAERTAHLESIIQNASRTNDKDLIEAIRKKDKEIRHLTANASKWAKKADDLANQIVDLEDKFGSDKSDMTAEIFDLRRQVQTLTERLVRSDKPEISEISEPVKSVYRECMVRFPIIQVGQGFSLRLADRPALARAVSAYKLTHPNWNGQTFAGGDRVTFRRTR